MIYSFEDCELDVRLCELRRGGEPHHVEPQVYDVLLHLVRNADRLVTQDELLEEVWGHRFVTPSAVSARIKSARQAVGDDGRAQRIIRTVRGRGFRIAVPVEVRYGDAPPPPDPVRSLEVSDAGPGRTIVGRPEEAALLEDVLSCVLGGQRRVVLVCGHAGVGKTTLAEAFAADLERRGTVVGRGQSLEQRGVGEPYLPVLEALGRLARGPARDDVVNVLAEYAPTWLTQMPALQQAYRPEAGETGSLVVTTRERMLREMVEAIEELTSRRPLVLVLEDVHWADRSTLDLILWLALRPEPARLLLLATYRSGASSEELRTLVRKLRRSECTTELELRPWAADGVKAYLDGRFPGHALPEELVELVLDRSAGNPLFAKSLIDTWVESGDLEEREGRWSVAADLTELATHLPASLSDAIEQQVDGLETFQHEILEAASVVGSEFLVAPVSDVLGRGEEEVERECAALARAGRLIGSVGAEDLPDGTFTARFAFAHELYREALYRHISAPRRSRMHARAGRFLETAYGEEAASHAGELALHFLHGRDEDRAVHWLTVAASQALRQSAHHEAVTHIEAALSILERRPGLEDALSRELVLQQMLGPGRLEIHGWDDPGAERAFRRAREIAERLQDPERVGQVLYSLAYFHEVRGEYPRAQEVVRERLELCEERPDERGRLEAHDLLSCSLLHQGRFRESLASAERALETLRIAELEGARFSPHHPGVSARYWAGIGCWFLGYPDRGLALVREARRRAAEIRHPPTLAFAESRVARLHQFRGEPELCAEHARAARELSDRHGFPYQRSLGDTLLGWAEAVRGRPEEGVGRIREALAAQKSAGTVMDHPYGMGLLAEALEAAGRHAEAVSVAREAREEVDRAGGSFFWSAELCRIEGVASAALGCTEEAEAALRRALETARAQASPSLELRALLALARLADGEGREEVLEALERVYGAFTEGLDSADLKEARSFVGSS